MRRTNPEQIIIRSWKTFVNQQELNALSYSADHEDANLYRRRWQKPLEGWYKLNVDGAMVIGSSKAGCGGVLRNNRGEWIVGYVKEIGFCDPYSAEEWAIFEGLKLAWDFGVKHLILESDARDLILRLEGGGFQTGSLLFEQIKALLCREWQVKLCYIPRDLNRLADALAKLGVSRTDIMEYCPARLQRWLDHEALGLNSPGS